MNKNDLIKKIKSIGGFKAAVWLCVLKIPKGETKTYKWVAEKIGKPKAFRAVGTALKKNPFAPMVPCHRVIKSNGELGSYSGLGGKKTKKKLLKLETESINS